MYNTFFISFFISNRKHWCGHLVSRCGDLDIAGEAQLGVGFTMQRGTDLPKDMPKSLGMSFDFVAPSNYSLQESSTMQPALERSDQIANTNYLLLQQVACQHLSVLHSALYQ